MLVCLDSFSIIKAFISSPEYSSLIVFTAQEEEVIKQHLLLVSRIETTNFELCLDDINTKKTKSNKLPIASFDSII